MHIQSSWVLAFMALTACASLPAPDPKEVFDEQTGNTLSVVAEPIIFARERTDVAAHARDYATLVAVEVDHSGDFIDYVLLYRWSTVDPRMSAAADPQAGKLRIFAEGRVIELMPLEQLPVGLSQRAQLYEPKHGDAVASAYQIDAMTLRFIASSGVLTLRMPQEPLDAPYGLWRDGRKALAQFVRRTGAP
jgi:hypothetical protein